MRRSACALGLAGLVALAGQSTASAQTPAIGHVWIVLLENKNYVETFGANTKAPYFAHDVAGQGQLLVNYYAITHLSLGNYIALLSGQPSNGETQSDCNVYSDFSGSVGSDGIAVGQGCVYPNEVKTLADQLDAAGLRWRGYMEDMGTECRHPAVGSRDDTQQARMGDQYATRHDPFVYFHSIIDDGPRCKAGVVPLDRLPGDLASEATTPNFSFVTPNLCNDGHDSPCVDGRPGGLQSADAWLRQWIPQITGSPAFQHDGLLIVTFDEAESGMGGGDAGACCNQPPGPNTPNPGGTIPGPGGGRTGAVLLSPFIRPRTVNTTPYNHYALLRTIEDFFGLGHLGYAAQPGLQPFGDDVWHPPEATTTPPGESPRAQACQARTDTLVPGPHHRLPVHSVLAKLVLRRPRTLRLTPVRRTRVDIAVTPRDGRPRHLRRRTMQACRTYAVRLPARHGTIRVLAHAGPGGIEVRRRRF